MKTTTSFKAAAFLAPILLLAAMGLRGPAPASGLRDAPNSPAVVQLFGSAAGSEPTPEPAAPKAAKTVRSGAWEGTVPACGRPGPAEEVIYQSDFRWDYTLPEMMARFGEMYASPKRLDKRAYWDETARSYVLPPSYPGAPIMIGRPLLDALRRHIELALELGYADAVFFPDMGHSHLLIPDALWEAKYGNYQIGDYTRLYEAMLSDPAIRIFYHTAEQLKTLQDNQPINDERLLFRRANRNIAGPITPDAELSVLQNPASPANTVSGVPGFWWWGAGFNFSAQKDGCFEYRHKGRTYRFDISLHDLPVKPGTGEDWQ